MPTNAQIATRKLKTQPQPPQAAAPEDLQQILDRAIEVPEKLAESQLDLARLFLKNNKLAAAERRLREIVEQFASSEAASEARQLLKNLCPP